MSFVLLMIKTYQKWFVKIGAIVMDAALMKQVEGACTKTFVVKGKRSKSYENHPYPLLSDKVYHLEKIRYKGTRYKRMQDEKVETMRDLLILLYTDPKQLEDAEAQNLVKFASEHLKAFDYFEDETSLKKHLQSHHGFTSLPSITDGPPTSSSQDAEACLNNLNQTPFETSQSERGKEKVPFDDEMIYATNYFQEHISFHPPTLNGPKQQAYGEVE
ncbi:putative CALMODULIN-BINDING PROTEIN60 [Helianthus annuus]|nr:putative CALMODULIN-BINDING PROTEIN60 [Helianthus annuus]